MMGSGTVEFMKQCLQGLYTTFIGCLGPKMVDNIFKFDYDRISLLILGKGAGFVFFSTVVGFMLEFMNG